MYIARDVFRLKFGQSKQAIQLVQKAFEQGLFDRTKFRIYTDFTGRSYRMIFECDFDTLANYELFLKNEMSRAEWQEWYTQFKLHVKSSYRELLKSVHFN